MLSSKLFFVLNLLILLMFAAVVALQIIESQTYEMPIAELAWPF